MNKKKKYNKFCKSCGKRLKRYNAMRCQSCAKVDKRNPNFKHGEYNKIHYCKEPNCNNTIHYDTWKNGNGRCRSCARKGRLNPAFGKKFPNNSKRMKNNKLGYIHGRGYYPYTKEFTSKLKEEIRNRDNHQCQNCGMTEEEHIIVYGRVIEIHHKDYNRKNCNENNLITLCKQCNMRANFNRSHWENFYKSKITEIINSKEIE